MDWNTLFENPVAVVGGCLGLLVILILLASWMLYLSWRRNIQDVLRESIAILATAKHEYTDQIKELQDKVIEALMPIKEISESAKVKLAEALTASKTEVATTLNSWFTKVNSVQQDGTESLKKQTASFNTLLAEYSTSLKESKAKFAEEIKQVAIAEVDKQMVGSSITKAIDKLILDAQPKLDAAIGKATKKPLPTYQVEFKPLGGTYSGTSWRAILTDSEGYRNEFFFAEQKDGGSSTARKQLIEQWESHLKFANRI